MKTAFIFITIALAAIASRVNGQGIKFEHSEWSKILKKAEAENKYVFVDFYASWCGPCRYMSRDVFTTAKAGSYFNQNFVSYKVDAENEEQDLVESIELTAYPTLIIFDAKGNVVARHVGAMDESELVEFGKKTIAYKTGRSSVLRNQATREQVLEYLVIAKTADTLNYQKMAPALAKTLTVAELSNPNAWDLFTTHVRDINDARFQFMIDHAKTLHEKHDSFVEYVDGVLADYLEKMIDAGNLAGLDLYKKSLQRLYGQLVEKEYDYAFFNLKVNALYYLQRGEKEQYAASLTKWVNGYLMDDWEKLSGNAVELTEQMKDRKHFDIALGWARKAVELKRNKQTVYSLAVVCHNSGDNASAIKYAEEVLTFELDDEEKTFITDFINELRS